MSAAAFVALAGSAWAAPFQYVSISCGSLEASGCSVGHWEADGWTARASFAASQNETGWATLHVETPEGVNDRLAAFSAGYAEGWVTADMIEATYSNFAAAGREPQGPVADFLRQQAAWVRTQVAQAEAPAQKKVPGYWRSVGLVMQQLEGLAAGYGAAAAANGLRPLSGEQIMFLGMALELDDIRNAVLPASRPDWARMSDQEFFTASAKSTHCSVLFRVTPDLSDLLAAHNTWTDYFWMLRIFKKYKLPFSTSKAHTVLFSGYPGVLAGVDDFYTTSQNLVVIETTNEIFNHSLYDFVTPNTVPYWVRVIVATRAATNARNWHDVFYRFNSGTYNNQWMVADYKRFTPGKPMPPWTFAVSEQLPGKFFHPAEDMTMVLQRGHWGSYNVAFYQDVYEVSGYPGVVKQRGVEASYQLAPRASIFRREAEKVNSLADMQRLMRQNNYGTSDPLAKTGYHAIAARGDLLVKDAAAFGAIDAKVVNKALMDAFAVSAIAGPTTEKQQPFRFTGRWSESPHTGMRPVFDYDWQTFSAEAMAGQPPAAAELVV